MVIFDVDKRKGMTFGRFGYRKVVTSIELADNPYGLVGEGICIVEIDGHWYLYTYDPKDMERYWLVEYGTQEGIWAMYFRRAQQLLNAWSKDYAEYMETHNEGTSRDETL